MANFAERHFELLERYQEQEYDNSDSEQTEAYQELKAAYAVTEDWARQIQRKLFPTGYVKVFKKPTSQGNKFLGYNWARIYPDRHSPDYLAYTIGINASSVFEVKIDTVHLRENHPIRRAYLGLRGDLGDSSPIVAMLPRAEGLRKTFPELVQWTLGAIDSFSLGYDHVWAELERNRTMDDEELLQHFAFENFRDSWTPESNELFCKLARVVHAANLDWWHVRGDAEARCGRKDPGENTGRVLAVVRGHALTIRINSRHEVGDIPNEQHHPLTNELVDQFESSLGTRFDFPDDWQRERPGLWPDQLQAEQNQSDDDPQDEQQEVDEPSHMPISPINLILHGPPGTGKTFSTAAEAVGLCGEPVDEDREVLMQVYQQLLAEGRIEFVTFHQSMSYEDFVEGRQPMTGSDDDDDTSSAGFRLETVPGIFRRIAKRAETSRGRSTGDDEISVSGRQVFKMSIGEASNPEDAHLFEDAIADGCTLLGFEDIDWSDDKYADREAIIRACKTDGEMEGHTDVNARSGAVQMPFIFRNWVRKGDIVVVSKGNSLFRAIGEFTGDYEYHPRPDDGYAHRRAVRWLWVDRRGVSVSEIYPRRFMQKSIYLLYDTELNIPALERYLKQPASARLGRARTFRSDHRRDQPRQHFKGLRGADHAPRTGQAALANRTR